MRPVEKPLAHMGLRDLRAVARARMPAEAWRHFDGAAESRATFHRNPRAFARYLFRQRIFHDVTDPDLSIELFGVRLSMPAAVAPVGSFSLIAEDAERHVAEGAERAGAMVFCSAAAKFGPAEWRAASKAPLVFMAYMNRGRDEMGRSAKLAEDLGFSAVGITMDTVRPVKIGDEVPLSTKDGKPRRGHPATPKDIEWMKRQVSLPVVIKGIMGAEDARIAVEAGADAVVVSNHGGRILDYNRSALEALPEVASAVGARVPVLFDSGIRSGGDIVKAVALGARAALVGRPVAWGVGAYGAAGVERVFSVLEEEMKRVLCMTGTPSIRAVRPEILIRDDPGALP
ncbi:MAG TPA: alpha-hydroxy-acid oxidizing protein [candidate division Zixibacteria bacterium]|nr:alpha-hydroxy-acid oxidizing protein [candidate division Zixibacteria bacterium]